MPLDGAAAARPAAAGAGGADRRSRPAVASGGGAGTRLGNAVASGGTGSMRPIVASGRGRAAGGAGTLDPRSRILPETPTRREQTRATCIDAHERAQDERHRANQAAESGR